jgi:formylglycine-generating enzyme required for sulfatase activity/energy-coupling factor transporter ATP-binding protein EcfA2
MCAMTDPRLDQAAQLRQSIASLEEQQRALGVDLSASIRPLRDLLAQLEQAAPQAVTHRSGGLDVTARRVNVAGDAVGRDHIEAGGHVIINEGGTIIVGAGSEPPVKMTAIDRESALGRYLQHVISRNRYLQLQGIRSGGKLVSIELDQIYVALRATRERTVREEDAWLKAEAAFAPGELHRGREGARVGTETVTVSVNEALAAHERLVVLGDPGSGKTTLLRYLALLYARDIAEHATWVRDKLGLSEARRWPILLPLRQIGAFLRTQADDGTEGHALLLDFLFKSLRNERLDLPRDFFDAVLQRGEAVILLDGLDEVADPDLRRRVAHLVEDFTRAYPQCRTVVTSRIVGYAGTARLGENFATTTVRDFTLADVERFLTHWHRLVAVGQLGPGESAEVYAADQTQQLLSAITANERVRELAINPLMLTVIAMVHRDRVKLPDRRAELYAEAVDVLLGKWEEAKGLQPDIAILDNRPFDTGDRRVMLQQIALKMHEGQLKEVTTEELQRWLTALFLEITKEQRAAERAVERFLHVIEERTGLLTARGEGVYAFSHLTFQEYLTALAIAMRDDYAAYTLPRVRDAWWREVILLEAGYFSTQGPERTTKLIRAIAELKDEPEPYHNLVLAAECLRDVGEGRVQGNLAVEVLKRLRADLELDFEGEFQRRQQELELQRAREKRGLFSRPKPAVELDKTSVIREVIHRKSAATQALVRAGAGYWTMPYGEPEWIKIPAGEFMMGTAAEEIPSLMSRYGEDKEWYQREVPRHSLFLPEYFIARVPVTNAQYALFVQAMQHDAPQGWEANRPPKGKEGHPVVYVSWHDARAYCAWLGKVTGKRITLPSEAQWEKAARGDRDQRAYPWGDAFEATRCNSSDLALGDTTPVGIFLNGASPYGCLDMAGNVWEWTSTIYQDYPYRADDGRENLEAGDNVARVLRGGSFRLDAGLVRGAYRLRGDPRYRDVDVGFRVVVAPQLS